MPHFPTMLRQMTGLFIPPGITNGSVVQTDLALDAPYVAGTSGSAYGCFFVPPMSGDLTDVWARVTSYAGLWTETDGLIQARVYEDALGNERPDTSKLVGTINIALSGSGSGWSRGSGSIPLTADRLYAMTISDSDGGAPGHAVMTSSARNSFLFGSPVGMAFITSDGWSSSGVSLSHPACVCMKIGGVMMGGSLFISRSNTGVNTLERGVKFTPTADVVLIGKWSEGSNEVALGSRLYEDGQPPGSPLQTWSAGLGSGWDFSGPPLTRFFPEGEERVLLKGKTYRFTTVKTVASGQPRVYEADAAIDADQKALFPFNGAYHYTYDNGAGGWTDDPTRTMAFCPILIPRDAPRLRLGLHAMEMGV